jgi:hypothetical protein
VIGSHKTGYHRANLPEREAVAAKMVAELLHDHDIDADPLIWPGVDGVRKPGATTHLWHAWRNGVRYVHRTYYGVLSESDAATIIAHFEQTKARES